MESAVPARPIEVDPLIAEAKRRARRRRISVVAALLVVVAVAVPLAGSLRPSGATFKPARPIVLRNAVALGTLVSINRRTDVAEFRISCGWHATRSGRATTKVPPVLYRVLLRRAAFTVESGVNPRIPGSGFATDPSLSAWERWERPGWRASLRLYKTSWLSDGPTTNICAGVLG